MNQIYTTNISPACPVVVLPIWRNTRLTGYARYVGLWLIKDKKINEGASF
jgi:hypothetical protein